MRHTTPGGLGAFLFVLLTATPSVLLGAPPIQQVDKLVPSDSSQRENFGEPAAVSGDTAVFGTRLDQEVHVYTRDADGEWHERQRLTPSGDELSFGRSIALTDDTMIIGAPHTVNDGGTRGAAYVFVRGGDGAWSLQARLIPHPSTGSRFFGSAVAVDGDTAVVSSHGDNDFTGSAHIFTRNANDQWYQRARVFASDGEAGDVFGSSVAVAGTTVLIGADRKGTAYVFTWSAGDTWSQQAKLVPGTGAGGDFGRKVALDGDTALIGASSDRASPAGAAYVFTRAGGGDWSEQTRLVPDDGEIGDRFGWDVSLDGDTAVVGTRWNDLHGWSRGSAYVFRRGSDEGWSQQANLLPAGGEAGDDFGSSVAVSGDTAIIGAPAEDSETGMNSGAAYVFDLNADFPGLHHPGDVDGDGAHELALVHPDGRVRMRNLNGMTVNGFEVQGPIIDSELMADTNGNGAPELVLLRSGPAAAEVRDLLTGASLATMPFAADHAPADLEVLPDATGNGIPELASLDTDAGKVEVRDGLTGEAISTTTLASYVEATDLEIYPDSNGNGWAELAVLADNLKSSGSDKIEVHDAGTGELMRNIWLGKDWRVLQQERIADLNGNGSVEVAVLRVHSDGRVNVMFRDSVTRAWLGSSWFSPNYPPSHLLSTRDLNGNGFDEVAVFGQRLGINTNNQKAKLRDSATSAPAGAGAVYFDRTSPVQDIVAAADVNGNGADELAALVRRPSDGSYRVIVKDASTGERLAVVHF